MTTNETTKSASWTDREVLIYLLGAIEHSKVKIDFAKAPVPAIRKASGCAQKMAKVKKALRNDIDALKSRDPADDGKAKGAKAKRKAWFEEVVEKERARKRGRGKKAVVSDEEEEEEEEEEGEVEV